MTTRLLPLFGIAVLLLSATMFVTGGSPTVYAEPQLGQGCQCHNNGIALWFNGTGYNGYSSITVAPGKSFKLNVTSANYAATGTVPGIQQWMMSAGDTSKFTITPQNVTLNSPLNVSPIKKVNSTISAIYTIVAPTQAGTYHIAISALGQTQGIAVVVQGSATTTTTSSGSSQTGTTTSTGTQTTTQSQGSTTQSQSSTQTTTSTPSTSVVITTTSTKAVPDVNYYGGELALIVVGFSVFLAVLILSYRRK